MAGQSAISNGASIDLTHYDALYKHLQAHPELSHQGRDFLRFQYWVR